MTADDAALLAALPHLAFSAMLLLARIGAAMMLLPGLGEAQYPARLRVAFAFAMTALLLPGLAPVLPAEPADIWGGVATIGAEVLTGITLGWLARLITLALPAAGQVIAFMTGLANVLQSDAATGGQAAVTGRMFGQVAPLVILTGGLWAQPLMALAHSYQVIPAGTLLPAADTAQTVVAGVGAYFSLAVRLAAPFILASTVWQVTLGLLGRLVPNLQVFMVAAPGQIVGGLLLLAVLATALLAAWSEAVGAGFAALPGAA